MRRSKIFQTAARGGTLALLSLLLMVGPSHGQSSGRGPLPANAGSAATPRSKAFIQDPAALFATGAGLAANGKTEEAKQIFETLIQIYPRLPEPYINLGVLLTKEEKTEAAAEALERGIYSHPVCVAAFNISLIGTLSPYSMAKIADIQAEHGVPDSSPSRVVPIQAVPSKAVPAKAVPAKAVPPQGMIASQKKNSLGPEETILAWAAAWTRQDADALLSFYAPSFRPSESSSLDAWQAERRLKIRQPQWIEVTINDLQINPDGAASSIASFLQIYRSDLFSDETRKLLHLEKGEQGWQITAEGSGSIRLREVQPATAQDVETLTPDTPAPIDADVQETALIVGAVTQWADAWSRQDEVAYLGSYSPSYNPGSGLDLATWKADRQASLTQPEWIDVEVSALKIIHPRPGRAVATFQQDYRSSTLNDTVRKTLRLALEGEEWKIISEVSR